MPLYTNQIPEIFVCSDRIKLLAILSENTNGLCIKI